MCDPVSSIVDIGANVMTGGLYGIGKAAYNTVQSGNPSDLLSQGFDLGGAATGNSLARDIGGNTGASLFNAAGGLAGAAGGAGVFAGSDAATTAPQTLAAGEGISGSNPESLVAQDVQTQDQALTQPLGVNGQYAQAPGTDSLTASSELGNNAQTDTLGYGAKAPTGPSLDTGTPSSLNTMSEPQLKGLLDNMPTGPAAKGWFESLPPMVQAGIVFSLPQLVAGSAGGLFQGVNAEKMMQLQQLALAYNQNQVQYLNRNNSFAPQVSFPSSSGMIRAASGR